MVNYRIGSTTLLAACCATSMAGGAGLVDDAAFSSLGGGCKDLSSGLVWSHDLRVYGFSAVISNLMDQHCSGHLNGTAEGGFYNDWRGHTVREAEEALANGLNSHLDFFNDGSPDDGVYRWTNCEKRVRGTRNNYAIRFTDGDVILSWSNISPNTFGICVRGLPPSECPGKKKGGPNNNALSQATTSAALLAPLCVAGIVCYFKRRRW